MGMENEKKDMDGTKQELENESEADNAARVR